MTFRKILCLVMALALAVCGCAFAEGDQEDLQARIAELEQQLADAQALVEQYRPYFEEQVLAEYDGGYVFLKDVQSQYDYYESMYSQSGITLTGSSYEAEVREQILTGAVEARVIMKRSAEEGFVLTDELQAEIDANVEETIQYYVDGYGSYFTQEGMSDDDIRAAVLDYLAQYDYGEDVIRSESTQSVVLNAVYDWLTKDVEVTEDDIAAEYEKEVAEDEASYSTSSYFFEGAVNRKEIVAWIPEGYRAVKQILIGFDDDQTTRYDEITSTISSLNSELTSESEDTRDEADILKELDEANAELDALYEELMPDVNEVIDRFNNGEDFGALMEEYTADTAMLREPLKSTGYYVHKDYAPWLTEDGARVSVWDDPFRIAAGSIENIGEISEPARGIYGIYIVYYMADVPAGAVPVEDLYDALHDSVYEDKVAAAYNDTIDRWVEECNVVYHLDRFR